MKRVLPILVSLTLVMIFGFLTYSYLFQEPESKIEAKPFMGDFARVRNCKTMPRFLAKVARRGVLIDLSQKEFKGVVFRYGTGKNDVIYKKEWGKFGYFGTYTLDRFGNIYFAPMPMISIEKGTFEAQRWIYKMDSQGSLDRWLRIDEVEPKNQNPYGVVSLEYDCRDNSLWVSSIDRSDYSSQKGRIYKIDIKSRKILAKWSGYDAFTVKLLKTTAGEYLLFGSAREPALFSWKIEDGKLVGEPTKLFELPDPTLKIRKIKIASRDKLKIEATKFNYSLVAESSDIYRYFYFAFWDSKNGKWIVKKLNR
jgi:hypothetical protein